MFYSLFSLLLNGNFEKKLCSLFTSKANCYEMSLPLILRFFKECFLLDNRSPALGNIFSNKFEDLLILEGEEQVLRDALPYYPVSSEYADKVQKKLSVYKKEKSLYYGLFLLTGEDKTALGGEKKLCAPLFLFPACIEATDMGDHGISIEKEKVLVNVRDLFRFREQEQDLYKTYINKIPKEFWQEGEFMQLCKLLKEAFPAIDVTSAVSYPKLSGEKEVRKAIHVSQLRKQEGVRLKAAAFFTILNNPPSFTGILDELEQLIQGNDYSAALKAVFDGQEQEKIIVSSHRYVAPGSLSPAQEKAILNAHQYPVSLVIGPPGTGKSYSVSNLAIDYLAQGKTVLIASKTDTAVDVIHTKIEETLSDLLVSVRGGRSDYQKKLRSHFSDLLAGTKRYSSLEKSLNPFKWSGLLNEADKELEVLKAELSEKIEGEIEKGKILFGGGQINPILTPIYKLWYRWEESLTDPLWTKASRLEELTANRAEYAKKYIQGRFLFHLLYTLKEHRQEIARFNKALRSKTSGNKEQLFEQINLNIILDALPIWLVNLNDISQVLPLEKEMFDLAIIDEATQCDISSCLPILQRARKVVIVGDPKQLRHVSFLSRSAQENILEKLNLRKDLSDQFNYRDNSILDLVNLNLQSQDQVSFLDEHFRSSPSLIQFSNSNFYNNSLSLMKSLPHHEKEALKFVKVPGRRSEKGYNEAEAQEILSKLKAVIEQEEQVTASLCSKIGILSPFREQADYLANLIQPQFSSDVIRKHQIMSGTAYSFQGEERDIMLLSFALDDNSHHSAFRHLEKHDVFNVSITRARNFQLVYYSFDCRTLDSLSLVRRYITSQDSVCTGSLTNHAGEYTGEVEAFLKRRKITYWKAYSLMGTQIDFLLKAGNNYLGLDLLGFPDEDLDTLPPERYQIFMRAGLMVFPLPYKNWLFNKEECMVAIKKALRIKAV